LLVLGLTFGLLLIKGLLMWPMGLALGGLHRSDALRLAVLLASGSEFAFVVLGGAADNGLLGERQAAALVLAITVSMGLTPLLVAGTGKLIGAKKKAEPKRPFDTITVDHPRVIIAGYGRMGQIVARILRSRGIPFVALDHSVEQLDLVQRFGADNDIFYGDPARPELLRAAQADKAEVFVLATDDPESSLRVARNVRRQYPNLKVIARARNRQHVWRLMDLGVEEPVRETLFSSLKMSRQTLEALGLDAQEAMDEVERFRRRDAQLLKAQYLVYDDEAKLVQTTREALEDLSRLFEADAQIAPPAERGPDADTPLVR
jgi:glutathione-regulated potassium-efflux system protein KefB